jgi:hypothetical protein
MADKKYKSKTKDPYLERNEFKKGFYDQPDKPPITAETMYGTDKTSSTDLRNLKGSISDKEASYIRSMRSEDKNIIQDEMDKVDQLDNYIGGRSPEDYKSFKETPYQTGSYKDGGDIHIEKGHNYIKDLIK